MGEIVNFPSFGGAHRPIAEAAPPNAVRPSWAIGDRVDATLPSGEIAPGTIERVHTVAAGTTLWVRIAGGAQRGSSQVLSSTLCRAAKCAGIY